MTYFLVSLKQILSYLVIYLKQFIKAVPYSVVDKNAPQNENGLQYKAEVSFKAFYTFESKVSIGKSSNLKFIFLYFDWKCSAFAKSKLGKLRFELELNQCSY